MLYDMDNCDEEKNIYEPAEYIPCPMCHPKLAIAYYISKSYDRKSAVSLVKSIRDNRKNGTEPWKLQGYRE
jgi:hypothetical protein